MMNMGCRAEKRRVGESSGMGVELPRVVVRHETDGASAGGAEKPVRSRRAFVTRRRIAAPVPLPIAQAKEAHRRRAGRSPATVAMANNLKEWRTTIGEAHPSTQAVARNF